jgi:preprotein translocase subunit YajC
MLFSTAFAQTAAGGGDFQSQLTQFLPLILIAGVFYFLLIRPQQQRSKQLKTALSGLRRGDKIVTAGGMIAAVSRVINDDEVEAEIAAGVKVRLLRSTITTILSKPEPAKGGKADKDVATTQIEDEIANIDDLAEANSGTKRKRAAARTAAAKTAATKAADEKPAEAAEPVDTKPTEPTN